MKVFRQVLWALAIQFLVFSLLFDLFKTVQQVYPPILSVNETHVHWNLYIDKNIEQVYVDQIKDAASRWSKATNNIADFNIEVMTADNRNQIRHDADAMIVTAITEDNPDVLCVDEENHESTVAFCNVKATIPILAYVEGRVSDETFEKVTLHELGHALKLEHVSGPEGVGQIMYPSTDLMGSVITQEDLNQFCRIYHCDSTKLQHEEETLHF
jgi:predicted Zn-dependent protease